MNGTSGQFSGVVDSINVKGDGLNSAQLLFAVRAENGEKRPFVVSSDADARMFAATATVLSLAFENGLTVAVTFQAAHPTNKAIEVEIRRTW
jgi:phosphoglucomutase